MISFLLSLASISTTISNLMLWQDNGNRTLSTSIQMVAILFAVIAILAYPGNKTRDSYTEWGVKIFTVSMALMVAIFIGASGLLVAILLGIQ